MDNNMDFPKAGSMVQHLLRALRHRNFRLFFIGQGISLIGTWMQQIAMSWLVYRLTGSAFLLGIVGFCSQIPTFLLSPFAGVVADRVRRRRLLLCTQTLSLLQAGILTVLVLTGVVRVWHIVSLSLVIGFVNSFDIPARHSFFVEMIENKEDLANAIALNSSMFNGARLIGPALAGALIAALGEGVCFLLNSMSFLAVIIALARMKLPPGRREVPSNPLWHELREGFTYAYGFVPIRSILLLLALVSLTGLPYIVLMPVFAREILHGGAHTFGFLMAASGIGAFTSALYLASRKSVLGLGRIIAASTALFGIALVIFSLSRHLWLSLLMLLVTGFSVITLQASSNTILQTIVHEDKRGRIMSFYSMSFLGMATFGSLLAGTLAGRIGAPDTVLLSGIACLAISLFFACKLPVIRKMIRPIYAEKGIIPEMARGIQTASEGTMPAEEQETASGLLRGPAERLQRQSKK
jgi:MFS family permease